MDGRRDGHALEDAAEFGAWLEGRGVRGRGERRYGADEALGPGWIGGEVEELVKC